MIPSWNINDQTILQSDWTKAFWPITCEPELFQIRGFHRNIESNKFLQQKIMKKFSHNSKKPVWAHFRKNTNFPTKKNGFYLFWVPMIVQLHAQYRKKLVSNFQEKSVTDGWTDERTDKRTGKRMSVGTDGQTWIHRALPQDWDTKSLTPRENHQTIETFIEPFNKELKIAEKVKKKKKKENTP